MPSIKSEKSRIGILRRTEEISPTLQSATFAPQTSVAIVDTIGDVDVHEQPNQKELSYELDKSPKKSVQNTSINSPKHSTNLNQYDFELKVPATIPLKSSLYNELVNIDEQNKDECQSVEVNHPKKKEIPYWLRPTPVQPYPYNFIMAVRKKLESITHPVVSSQQYQWPELNERLGQVQQIISEAEASFHSPIARPNTQFAPKNRLNLERKQSESEKSMSENVQSSQASPVKSSQNVEKSSEQEEYSMNFSSATFESKPRQSDAHQKSKQKSISQDTLSISSGILSHSSPEKKVQTTPNEKKVQKDDEVRQPSPLTTDNVDGLHITSRNFSQNEGISAKASSVYSQQSIPSSVSSHINFGRGNDYSISGQPSLSKGSKEKSMEELLNDFKSSLSQVIKVNRRLHDMLSNPSSSRTTRYSDDFTSEQKRSNTISERIAETHESTSVPTYKSQYTASEIQSNGQTVEERVDHSTETERIETSLSNASTETKTVEENSEIVSNEYNDMVSNENSNIVTKSASSMQKNLSNTITSNEAEESDSKKNSTQTEKESSTLIEEKVDDYQSSESPTNNDLKSISLSIAKKSIATSDDTDQPSNVIESFSKQITGARDVANESVGSDIFNMFNKTALNMGDDINASIWSEQNISYSTLGLVRIFFIIIFFIVPYFFGTIFQFSKFIALFYPVRHISFLFYIILFNFTIREKKVHLNAKLIN